MGFLQRGFPGAIASWAEFTLPSAIALVWFGWLQGSVEARWLHGLKAVTVAIVAQAVPGPLFAFAAYLGPVSHQSPAGWLGATIALLGIFLPAFLLVSWKLPPWLVVVLCALATGLGWP